LFIVFALSAAHLISSWSCRRKRERSILLCHYLFVQRFWVCLVVVLLLFFLLFVSARTHIVRHLCTKLANPLVCWVSTLRRYLVLLGVLSNLDVQVSCQKWAVAYLLVDGRCLVDRNVRKREEEGKITDSEPPPQTPFL
jgi:hypothetical protein